ncbi:MAG TPA: hypothetical protein PKC22_01960 [Rhodocyclaceae bacterium]|nr:hypothetical protein [Rhodocyclaceae bacterium]
MIRSLLPEKMFSLDSPLGFVYPLQLLTFLSTGDGMALQQFLSVKSAAPHIARRLNIRA